MLESTASLPIILRRTYERSPPDDGVEKLTYLEAEFQL